LYFLDPAPPVPQKFWIDVVGARIAKAIGSTINNVAGSVDRSIRVASAPSLFTAAALWFVCYRAGRSFDSLIETGKVVGVDDDETTNAINYADVVEGDDGEDLIVDTVADDDGTGIFEDPTTRSLELSPRRLSC